MSTEHGWIRMRDFFSPAKRPSSFTSYEYRATSWPVSERVSFVDSNLLFRRIIRRSNKEAYHSTYPLNIFPSIFNAVVSEEITSTEGVGVVRNLGYPEELNVRASSALFVQEPGGEHFKAPLSHATSHITQQRTPNDSRRFPVPPFDLGDDAVFFCFCWTLDD